MVKSIGFIKSVFIVIVLVYLSYASALKVCPNNEKGDVVRLQVHLSDKLVKTITLNKCTSKYLTLNEFCKPNMSVKLIAHGFAERWNMTTRWNWVEDMIYEMFQSSEADKLCVIAIDWKELAYGGIIANYWAAISNMQIAGDFISDALNNSKINIKNTHCIGFSLGVHLCSIIYKIYYQKFSIKPGRLTGLDPAGPFFQDKPTNEKIHHTDADFVDVIHTSESFGVATDGEEHNGHMDFYADGGAGKTVACDDYMNRYEVSEDVILYEESNRESHPKYEDIYLEDSDIPKKGIFGIDFKAVKNKISNAFKSIINKFRKAPKRIFVKFHQFFGCSHLMSVRFFIYSINDCMYQVSYCNSTTTSIWCSMKDKQTFARMGYHADRSAQTYKTSYGSFYVTTSSKAPFCFDKMNRSNKKQYKITKRFYYNQLLQSYYKERIKKMFQYMN